MKKLLLLASLLVFFVLSGTNINAQTTGTITCEWNPAGVVDPATGQVHFCLVSQTLSDPSCPNAPFNPGTPEDNYCFLNFNNNRNACNAASGFCNGCFSPNVCTLGPQCPGGQAPTGDVCVNPSSSCCPSANPPTATPTLPPGVTPTATPAPTCYECQYEPFGGSFSCNTVGAPPGSTNCSPYFDSFASCNSVCNDPSQRTYECVPGYAQCTITTGGTYPGTGTGFNNCNAACLATGPPCTGIESDLPGQCKFLLCGPGFREDGKNPPDNLCSFAQKCCIPSSSFPPGPTFDPLDPQAGCSQGFINTAIGCIPTARMLAFLSFVLRFGVGLAGGMSFLLILLSSLQITTSGGNPDRLKAGKELLTAAISGLVLVIFSVFLLEVIGVRILALPGF